MGSSWEYAVEKELLIFQGNFPGMPVLAGAVRVGPKGASLRGWSSLSSSSQTPGSSSGLAVRLVGFPFTAFFVSLFKNLGRTFFFFFFQSDACHGVLPGKEFQSNLDGRRAGRQLVTLKCVSTMELVSHQLQLFSVSSSVSDHLCNSIPHREKKKKQQNKTPA